MDMMIWNYSKLHINNYMKITQLIY